MWLVVRGVGVGVCVCVCVRVCVCACVCVFELCVLWVRWRALFVDVFVRVFAPVCRVRARSPRASRLFVGVRAGRPCVCLVAWFVVLCARALRVCARVFCVCVCPRVGVRSVLVALRV